MANLNTAPSPVAIFPDFIAQLPETLIMKRKHLSNSYDVRTTDGRPLLTIKAESQSLSHRKHFYDVQGSHLCTVRRKTWTLGTHYYAETPAGGNRLFEIDSKFGFSGSKNTINFVNAVTGQREELLFKNNAWSTHGTITNNSDGRAVADVDRKMWKMSTEYHVMVAQGVDKLLIMAICVSMDDKAKTDSKAAAAGAGA